MASAPLVVLSSTPTRYRILTLFCLLTIGSSTERSNFGVRSNGTDWLNPDVIKRQKLNPKGAVAKPWDCSGSIRTAIPLPVDVLCPSTCPFSQPLDGVACKKVCIAARQCREFHPVRFYPDEETWSCEPSCGHLESHRIAGCHACAEQGRCSQCSQGLFGLSSLELSADGTECINLSEFWWKMAYTMAALVAIAGALYGTDLALRDPNPAGQELLKKGLESRECARTELRGQDIATSAPNGPARQWSNLWTVNPHRIENAPILGGRGVTLYFNWLLFGIAVAFILMVASFYAFELSDLERRSHDKKVECAATVSGHAGSGKVGFLEVAMSNLIHPFLPAASGLLVDRLDPNTNRPRDIAVRGIKEFTEPVEGRFHEEIEKSYKQYYERMFNASLFSYILVTLLVWAFTYWQTNYVAPSSNDGSAAMPATRGFCALVSRLPHDLVDGKKVTDHFQHQLDRRYPGKEYQIIGTSIAFDYYQFKSLIDDEIQRWFESIENKENVHTHRHKALNKAFSGEEVVPAMFFDKLLMRAVLLEEEDALVVNGSTYAFIVCETQEARDALVSLGKGSSRHTREFMTFEHTPASQQENSGVFVPQFIRRLRTASSAEKEPILKKPKPYVLRVEEAPCEPLSVKWENFSIWNNFWHKIALGILGIILTFVMWICLYVPYAIYYADLAVIPGHEPTLLQDIVLGGLIAVGNAIIALVIDIVTDWAGFFFKHQRDRVVMAMAFICTLVNTLCDLAMVAVVAKGVMLENAFAGKSSSYSTVVAEELFKLMVPGYLILPYLGQPIAVHIAPYLLAKFLIRAHARVTRSSANKALLCSEFDICWRYSDILNNMTLCTVLLFFSSACAWKVMGWLIVFLLLIYCIDKYLVLNFTTTTIYDNNFLSCDFAMWWCVPTLLLSIVTAYWGNKADVITDWRGCIAIPIAHVFAYMAVMAMIELSWNETPTPQEAMRRKYSELAEYHHHSKPFYRQSSLTMSHWDFYNTNPSFFNTNMVFCLRTRFPDVKNCQSERATWKEIASRMHGTIGTPRFPAVELCLPLVRGKLDTINVDKARPFWGMLTHDA